MDSFTDIDFDGGVTVRRGNTELEVYGIFARVHWFDTKSPQIMVQDWKNGHHEIDTSDPWLAEVAAAVRRKLNTPEMLGRIHDEVEQDQEGKREAAREQAYEWHHQAAE